MKRSLAEQLFEIAVWIEDYPGDYQVLPDYLRDAFCQAVREVHKSVRVADVCEKCGRPGAEHKELGECPK